MFVRVNLTLLHFTVVLSRFFLLFNCSRSLQEVLKDQKIELILVFYYQNWSDLLWEKIVLVIEKNFWNLNRAQKWKTLAVIRGRTQGPLITGKSLSEALLFAEHGENMLRTKMSETISVHNMFSPGLSLEFSCIELVIQWTIWRHIVG